MGFENPFGFPIFVEEIENGKELASMLCDTAYSLRNGDPHGKLISDAWNDYKRAESQEDFDTHGYTSHGSYNLLSDQRFDKLHDAVVTQVEKYTNYHDINPSFHITKVLSVKVLGESIATSNFEIDENAGFIHRTDGFFEKPTAEFPLPVVIEYEYGWDYIRNGVDRIGLKLLVDRIVASNIPDRATSFNDELGNIALVTQGGGFKNPTRIPEVNQWIEENSEKVFGI